MNLSSHIRISILIMISILISILICLSPPSHADTQRQFVSKTTLTGGIPMTLVIVAAQSDEKAAQSAMADALAKASAFTGEIFGPSGLEETIELAQPGQPVKVSGAAFKFMRKALDLSASTAGWFDVTAPSPKHAFTKSDWRQVELDAGQGSITLKRGDLAFDLKRLAIAFSADIALEAIAERGFANASVSAPRVERNLGKDIFTPWNVVIEFGESPGFASRAMRLGVSDTAFVTVTPEGLGYGLSDPKSKKPLAPRLRGVTVFAQDSATALAYAISAFTLGPKYGVKFLKSHPEIKWVMAGVDGFTASEGLLKDTGGFERAPILTDGGPNDLQQKKREEEMDE